MAEESNSQNTEEVTTNTSRFSNWRSWIRPTIVIAYAILVLILVPICLWQVAAGKSQLHTEAWSVAGIFTILTVPISLWQILQHLLNYTQPILQKHIIRILWMVPIYSLNSWIALRFPGIGFYFDTVRRCYEAYVIYNFMVYLMNFLQTEYDIVAKLEAKPQITHLFPFCKLKTWPNGRQFIRNCRIGVLTYTVVMPITTLIALGLHLAGAYHEGKFNFYYGYPYIILIDNFTQLVALYCLTLFYKAFREELKPIKPIGKFAAIKFVIFFSFWQDCLISILVDTKVITANKTWNFYNPEMVAKGLQDFLICIEMFIVAIAHYFVFSHKPYVDKAIPPTSLYTSFISMWDVSDVRQDVAEHFKGVSKWNFIRKKRQQNTATENILSEELTIPESETSRLLRNDDKDDLQEDFYLSKNHHVPIQAFDEEPTVIQSNEVPNSIQ